MSDIDPEKLKVAELRDELKNRGLDTKGNKAALVARLKEALQAAEEEEENDAEQVEDEEEQEEQAVEESEQQEEEEEEEENQEVQQETEAPAEEGNEEEMAVEESNAQQQEAEAQPAESAEAQPAESAPAAAPAAAAGGEEQQAAENGEGEEEVVLGEEFQTIDEASQDDNEEGNIDRKRKRSRSPRERHRRSRSRERHRRSRSHERRRHSPPPRKVDMDDTAWESLTTFNLDRFDCDLNLRFDDNNVKAHPLTVDGFGYMWAGVRAMFGIKSGKVAYEVKVLEDLNVDHLPRDEPNPHVLRVGWSVNSTSLNLGEEELSYGYGGTGKRSTACNFEDYGQKFGPGDVITAYLDLESDPVIISYSKNGEDLGSCFEVEKEKLGDNALFPHLMTKNTEFECNFGAKEEPWFALKEGFSFLEQVAEENRVRGMTPPATKEECQVIMMVGLPGAGKTYWAENYSKANPDKRYNVLGTNNIIDKMKVMGLPRKENYGGRWYVLFDKANKCLNRLIEVATRKKRNYILDQTNVYASARRRKMQPFEGFQRKAVVVLPTDEEFKNRVKQRTDEEKKDVPESAVLEMKANFILPEESNGFDSIEFTEDSVPEEEREKLIEQYRKEGRDALPPPEKRFRGADRFTGTRDWRGGDRRGGWRGGFDRDRRGGNSFRGHGFNASWRPYERRGGSGNYRGRDDRRRDDRTAAGYKGRGSYNASTGANASGWRGGNNWNTPQQQWGNQQYNQGWGGYNQGYNQGWGANYNQGWGGYGQSGYNQGWGGYGYK